MNLADLFAQESGPSGAAATEVLQYGALGAFAIGAAWLIFYFIRDALRQRDRAVEELAATNSLLREMRDRDVELLQQCRDALRSNADEFRRMRDRS